MRHKTSIDDQRSLHASAGLYVRWRKEIKRGKSCTFSSDDFAALFDCGYGLPWRDENRCTTDCTTFAVSRACNDFGSDEVCSDSRCEAHKWLFGRRCRSHCCVSDRRRVWAVHVEVKSTNAPFVPQVLDVDRPGHIVTEALSLVGFPGGAYMAAVEKVGLLTRKEHHIEHRKIWHQRVPAVRGQFAC